VAPKTQFSLEIGKAGARQQTSLGLVAGMISLKCAKLTDSQAVSVKTESAALGVRGTRFTVTAPASGDILVTCDEGEVVCTDEEGGEQLSLPGQAVEQRAGERLRRVPVAVSSLEQYQRDWLAERISSLKANALKATAAYARRYDQLSRQFSADFAALMKAGKLIDKWAAEDREGRIGGAIEAMKEKKEIVGALFRLRRTLFIFERVYARLLEMKEYHDQGFGRGTLWLGLTSTQFFQRLERDRRDLEGKMAKVRYVARLYALRNDGRVPTGSFDDEEEEGDSFGG
jgi:hypothetical protein